MRMARIALTAPDVSLKDIYDFKRGQAFAGEALYRELLDYDARKLGPQFATPILIVNGDRDLVTPPDLIREWFDTVRSPHKDFVVLSGGGHSAILTMPDQFLNALLLHLPPALADAG
jgi:pimeloyl-ACP methyl ester carboxylesterase